MKGAVLTVGVVLACTGAVAQSIVPLRAVRAEEILTPDIVTVADARWPGTVTELAAVIGQEARVTLYAGRPIVPSDLAPPAVIERNQMVRLHYRTGGLSITADGRALGRGRPGESMQVLNAASRIAVWGTVREDGSVEVSQ